MTRAHLITAAVFVPAAAALATASPLFVYAVTLAMFGLPHVLAEMQYVDRRFGGRLDPRLVAGVLVVIGGIVGLRAVGVFGGGIDDAAMLELFLVALLALAVIPACRRCGGAGAAVALLLVAGLAAGILAAPAATLVLLAFLHNATPVAFIAERVGAAGRATALALCGLVFVAVPAAIVAGIFGAPGELVATAPFLAGELGQHTRAFVPAGWFDDALRGRLFAAATYLQVMHYAAVLWLLPRLQRAAPIVERGLVRWPSARTFRRVLFGVGAATCFGFMVSFTDARAVYGLFAVIHAWIEVPVLVAAASIPFATGRAEPAT